MTVSVCRIFKEFPSISSLKRLSAREDGRVNYTQYGLAPGIYSLMEEQVKLGARVDVVSARSRKISEDEKTYGIEVHRVGKPFEMMTIAKIRKMNRRKNFDIIHAHATSGFFYSFLKRFLREKRPLVVHVHGTTAGVLHSLGSLPSSYKIGRALKERFWSWISLERQKAMWPNADKLLCVSSNISEELEHFYGISRDRTLVVYNGVDAKYFRPASDDERARARKTLGIRDDAPFLLYVGHLSPRKGINLLLEAAPAILEEFSKATFAFLGGIPGFVKRKDYLKIWLGLAEKMRIRKNLLFLGEVMHRDTLKYYHAADVFVFPTLYEGLAKALLEAMACELPIVATKAGGNKDALRNKETGLLVKPYDPDEMASAVIEVLSNPSLASQMGKKARKTVCSNFTWRKVAEKIHSAYDEILRNRN